MRQNHGNKSPRFLSKKSAKRINCKVWQCCISAHDISARLWNHFQSTHPMATSVAVQYFWMRSSGVVRVSDSQCRGRNCPGFDPSIPASSDTVQSEWRQMKHCWISYIKRKKQYSKLVTVQVRLLPHCIGGFKRVYNYVGVLMYV